MKVRFRRHRWKGGCLAGENVRFSPLEQATRRAWGIYDSLACRAGDPKVMKYRVEWLREYTFDCKKNTLVTRVFSSGNQGV